MKRSAARWALYVYLLEDEYHPPLRRRLAGGRETFRRLYTELAGPMQVERTRLFPGARELLEALKAAGVPAGVVSTKRYETLREILQARGVTPLPPPSPGAGRACPPSPTRRACSPPSGPRAWRRGRSSTAGTRLSTRRRPSGAAYPSARCSTAPPARRTSRLRLPLCAYRPGPGGRKGVAGDLICSVLRRGPDGPRRFFAPPGRYGLCKTGHPMGGRDFTQSLQSLAGQLYNRPIY